MSVGIGVGIAGQVDAERGLLVGTANLSRAVVDLPMAERNPGQVRGACRRSATTSRLPPSAR